MMGGYQIIKFVEENTVEVVPSAWLVQDGEQQACLWPNTPSQSIISLAIKSQQLPKDDWKKHAIQVLSKHAYESFTTATAKATKATYTSCLESESEEGMIAGMSPSVSKRSRKRNKRFISSSDDDDSPLMSRSPNKWRKMSVSRSTMKYPTPPKIQRTDSQYTGSEAAQKVKNNLGEKMASVIVNSQNRCSSCIKHEDLLTQIIRLLHVINGRVGQNSELITTLLNSSEVFTAVTEPENEMNDIDIPARSYEDLMNLKKKLDDKKVKEFLVKKLVHVGGSNIKEPIKRTVPRFVSDEVLKEFSWIGGKGKKIFSHLNMAAIIKDVCKQNLETKTVSEKVVEGAVALFLTKSTERCNRRMSKENKTKSINTDEVTSQN